MSAHLITALMLSLAVSLGTGCDWSSPEAKKAKHRERAASYFEKGQYNEAIIEYANVITRHCFATRAGFYRQQFQSSAVSADGPAGFRLPPMIDHWNAELRLGPRQRVRIAAFACKKQRAKLR